MPTAGMPGPVRAFAAHQPVTSIVNTIRDLYAQQAVGDECWIALAWCIGLLLLAYGLAILTGVTVRAVRHYHATGLLPEPERDHSGYRRWDAAAVVELIRIRTLAEAGVPLPRVKELLAADDEEFAASVADVSALRRPRADGSMEDFIAYLSLPMPALGELPRRVNSCCWS